MNVDTSMKRFLYDQANLYVKCVSDYLNLLMLKFIELYIPKSQLYCVLI